MPRVTSSPPTRAAIATPSSRRPAAAATSTPTTWAAGESGAWPVRAPMWPRSTCPRWTAAASPSRASTSGDGRGGTAEPPVRAGVSQRAERELPVGLRNRDPADGAHRARPGRPSPRLQLGGPWLRRHLFLVRRERDPRRRASPAGETLVERDAAGRPSARRRCSPPALGSEVRYGDWFLGEQTRISDLRSYDLASGRRGRAAVEPRLAGAAAEPRRDRLRVLRNSSSRRPAACCWRRGAPRARRRRSRARARAAADDRGVRTGWTAFSTFDAVPARLPADAAWSPVRRAARRRRRAPRVPFDVDLGPWAERAAGGRVLPLPRRAAPRSARPRCRCPATGAAATSTATRSPAGGERKVPIASRAGASEYLPTIFGTRSSFARRAGSRAPALYAGRPGGGRLVRLAAGPRGHGAGLGPRALDLQGRRLALTWESARRDGSLDSEVRLDAIGGGGRTAGASREPRRLTTAAVPRLRPAHAQLGGPAPRREAAEHGRELRRHPADAADARASRIPATAFSPVRATGPPTRRAGACARRTSSPSCSGERARCAATQTADRCPPGCCRGGRRGGPG